MFSSLISLFFPALCAGCDAPLTTGERSICIGCRHSLPLTHFHLLKENEAYGKFYGRLPVEHVSALCYFHKRGIVQKMTHQLKYRGQESVGEEIGSLYGHILSQSDKFERPDAIIPVPLHPKRLKERGYNQVTAFALAMGDALRIPVRENLLERAVYAKTQTRKNLFQRSSATTELFKANPSQSDAGKHFLIVDDVITTGATLEACGRALMVIPDVKISIACMAFAHS
jgi:ComF family protein